MAASLGADPVFFAAMIAYMLDPVVDRLESKKIPRALAIVLLLALVLVVLVLLALLIVPSIVREFSLFLKELPGQLDALRGKVEPWLKSQGVDPPHSVQEAYKQLGIDAKQLAGKAVAPAGKVLDVVLGGTASVLGTLATAVIIPVFAFYLLYDWDRMMSAIRDLIPWRVRPHVVDMAGEIDEVLGQFIRGQLLVMGLLAVLYAVAYGALGVRLAVPIGIIAGLLSFIPYVGGATALGLALLMCGLTGTTPMQLGGVVAAYTVIQILEGFVITPRIMEDKIGLGAVWVLLALMVFGELFGFLGVLLAVPLAAVLKILLMRAVAFYRKSDFFAAGEPGMELSPAGARPSLFEGILKERGLPDDPDVAARKRVRQSSIPPAAAEPPSQNSSASEADSEAPDSEPPDSERQDSEAPDSEPPESDSSGTKPSGKKPQKP